MINVTDMIKDMSLENIRSLRIKLANEMDRREEAVLANLKIGDIVVSRAGRIGYKMYILIIGVDHRYQDEEDDIGEMRYSIIQWQENTKREKIEYPFKSSISSTAMASILLDNSSSYIIVTDNYKEGDYEEAANKAMIDIIDKVRPYTGVEK